MSNQNQANKDLVWDFWHRMNYAKADAVPDLVKKAFHPDVNWNGSAPINQLQGVDSLIGDFWLPLLRSFPDIKRHPYVFMGGIDDGTFHYSADKEEAWVSGCGYLTGTFAEDWLGIPATGKKTHISFSQFYVMQDGKITESYVMFDIVAVMRQAGYHVLPPAPGAEGGKIPPPAAGDGVLLTEQDALETRKTFQLVRAMIDGLVRYNRQRDGGDLRSMEQYKYWHPNMHWYGPTGIGMCLSLEEFEDFHQRPWLEGFGDRSFPTEGRGRAMGFVSEGLYCSGGIWDVPFSRHNGTYMGIPATGKVITLRDFDWWKRDGDRIIENWVPIDMIDLSLQLGVDVFARLREQIE